MRAVLEHGLTGLVGIGQHRVVDVDDHLIAVGGDGVLEAVVKRGGREKRQGVGALLGRRGRIAQRVARPGERDGESALVQRLARGVQGLDEQRAHLGLEPAAEHHRAVVVVEYVQGPVLMAELGLVRLGLAVHPAPAAHDALHVRGGASAAHAKEALLRLRRGHPGERAHLGVGELAARERRGQSRQRREGSRHPHALAGGTEIHPHAPGQPLGAGAEARVPAAAGVELPNEIEQARRGGIEMGGELGDLVAQALQLGDARVGGDHGGSVVPGRDRHRRA